MNRLNNLHMSVCVRYAHTMVKFVMGGGTQNLLDKRENRLDKR